MINFEKTLFINRPRQEVFDYVTNFNNDAKWQKMIESVELVSGGSDVGSVWRYKLKFLGKEIESEIEVTGYNPPNSASVKSSGGPVPFENLYTFESQDGGTKLTIAGQAEVGGFFSLAEGMFKKQFEKQMDSDADRLKQVLEAS